MVGESGICDVFVELIVARGLMGIRGSKPQEAIQNNLKRSFSRMFGFNIILTKDGILYTLECGALHGVNAQECYRDGAIV